jgi:hypothetical protein
VSAFAEGRVPANPASTLSHGPRRRRAPQSRFGCRRARDRVRGRAITTLSTAASSLCRLCDRPLPRRREIKAAVRSGAHRGSLLGDRSSARFGGRRGSSPPWDQHRRPARTTASIRALARRLQARDARLWRNSGLLSRGGPALPLCPHGYLAGTALVWLRMSEASSATSVGRGYCFGAEWISRRLRDAPLDHGGAAGPAHATGPR